MARLRRRALNTSQPKPSTRAPITTLFTTPCHSSAWCQRSPRRLPTPIHRVFQSRLPAAVRAVKRQNGMRSAPAGMLTTERTTGTRRPKNTTLAPWRSNHRKPVATSSGVKPTQRPDPGDEALHAVVADPGADAVEGPRADHRADRGHQHRRHEREAAGVDVEARQQQHDLRRDRREDALEGEQDGHADQADGVDDAFRRLDHERHHTKSASRVTVTPAARRSSWNEVSVAWSGRSYHSPAGGEGRRRTRREQGLPHGLPRRRWRHRPDDRLPLQGQEGDLRLPPRRHQGHR